MGTQRVWGSSLLGTVLNVSYRFHWYAQTIHPERTVSSIALCIHVAMRALQGAMARGDMSCSLTIDVMSLYIVYSDISVFAMSKAHWVPSRKEQWKSKSPWHVLADLCLTNSEMSLFSFHFSYVSWIIRLPDGIHVLFWRSFTTTRKDIGKSVEVWRIWEYDCGGYICD